MYKFHYRLEISKFITTLFNLAVRVHKMVQELFLLEVIT